MVSGVKEKAGANKDNKIKHGTSYVNTYLKT